MSMIPKNPILVSPRKNGKTSTNIYDLFERSLRQPVGRKQEELLTQILATLVKANGGELVIPESELASAEETVLIEVDGFIKITLIPDYVKTGVEESLDGGSVIPGVAWDDLLKANPVKWQSEWFKDYIEPHRKTLAKNLSDQLKLTDSKVVYGFDPAKDAE